MSRSLGAVWHLPVTSNSISNIIPLRLPWNIAPCASSVDDVPSHSWPLVSQRGHHSSVSFAQIPHAHISSSPDIRSSGSSRQQLCRQLSSPHTSSLTPHLSTLAQQQTPHSFQSAGTRALHSEGATGSLGLLAWRSQFSQLSWQATRLHQSTRPPGLGAPAGYRQLWTSMLPAPAGKKLQQWLRLK
jgi:hypothetical protein